VVDDDQLDVLAPALPFLADTGDDVSKTASSSCAATKRCASFFSILQ
jgi:hypothetical protein